MSLEGTEVSSAELNFTIVAWVQGKYCPSLCTQWLKADYKPGQCYLSVIGEDIPEGGFRTVDRVLIDGELAEEAVQKLHEVLDGHPYAIDILSQWFLFHESMING